MGFGNTSFSLALAFAGVFAIAPSFGASRQMENLNHGLVAANVGSGMLVSWRLLGTEKTTTQYNLYRDGNKIATIKESEPTNYLDASGTTTSVYTVAPVVDGVEGSKEGLTLVYDGAYKSGSMYFPYKVIYLDAPQSLTMPDGSTCVYSANDMSTGDLDGDGELELVVKWDPNNSKDNANSGYTGNVYIDGYKLDGTKLWRIDLGKNIRAGAHYTQFMVYDLDGDGIAEIAMKTSDGTVDGLGNVIGTASADYRTSSGTIMSGNEYLTIFNGTTGAAMKTIDYWPARGKISGDSYGNRDNRMLAAVAYLDGVHPSLIMSRGYYTESFVAAYDWDGSNLTTRWQYSATTSGSELYGQGNHNLSVGDIDGDGYDEIVYGAGALNHDGTFRYRTGLGHGDAMHLTDLDPDYEGLEVFDVHEETSAAYSDEMHDKNGKIIWGTAQTGGDNGRGMAADLDSTNRGFEMWSYASGSIRDAKGNVLWDKLPAQNFRIYFDGDLQDELLDAVGSPKASTYAYSVGGKIDKWNQSTKAIDRYFSFYNVESSSLNNYTKANPCLVADILGDWREELITRASDDQNKIIIFSTPVKTDYRVYTLMHDAHYRVSIAWQNVAYNQPPHLGYYLPDHVGKNLTQPNIYTASYSVPTPTLIKSGAGSSSQALTLGESFVEFSYVYKNCTSASVTGLPSGVSSVFTTNSNGESIVKISGTPTEAGTFKFTVTTVGGNGTAAQKSGTIVVTDPNVSSSSAIESSSSSIDYEGEETLDPGFKSEVNAAVPDDYDGVYEEYNAGWLDSGYFNFTNAVGSFVTYELYSKNSGTVTVAVHYANGGVDPRNMRLTVNGIDYGTIEFASTEGWATWYETEFTIDLTEGKNTITLTSLSATGGPNIDLFYFSEYGICLYRDYESGKVSFEETSVAKVKGNPIINAYNMQTGKLFTQEDGFAEIYYYGVNGQMKFGKTAYMQAGESAFKVTDGALSKGRYFVKVKFNGIVIGKGNVVIE